jgi:hypothetical protein
MPYVTGFPDVHEARDLAQRLCQNRAPAPAVPPDIQNGCLLGHLVVLHSRDIPLNPTWVHIPVLYLTKSNTMPL